MSENNYNFVETDSEKILTGLISSYESLTGRSLSPGDPDRLFISWVAYVIAVERNLQNYVGNQNIPSRAEGDNLDALGEMIYNVKRTEAKPSICTMEFNITAPQNSAVVIPRGTRVTNSSQTLVWSTTADILIPAGLTSVIVSARCETAGSSGNGYLPGQINTLIDADNVPYFASCRNLDTTNGGSERLSDSEYFELMKKGLDAYSTAGPKGAYEYFAKKVSPHIADVIAVQPSPGCVNIYAVMDDGTPADEGTKASILAACSDDKVRPLTDYVEVKDVDVIQYQIDLVYYVRRDSERSLIDISAAVDNAVNEYIKWQSGKIGRDISPSNLMWFLKDTGIKRVEILKPERVVLNDGSGGIPQIAENTAVNVVNGGYEDE